MQIQRQREQKEERALMTEAFPSVLLSSRYTKNIRNEILFNCLHIVARRCSHKLK